MLLRKIKNDIPIKLFKLNLLFLNRTVPDYNFEALKPILKCEVLPYSQKQTNTQWRGIMSLTVAVKQKIRFYCVFLAIQIIIIR